MAHESFENPAITAVMNELFVNIKVGREGRPVIDHANMSALRGILDRRGRINLTANTFHFVAESMADGNVLTQPYRTDPLIASGSRSITPPRRKRPLPCMTRRAPADDSG
jgi:hypothetical protein